MSYRDAKLARDLRRRQLEEELAELTDGEDGARVAHARRRRIAWWLSFGITLWMLGLAAWRLGLQRRSDAKAATRASAAALRQTAQIYLAAEHDLTCPDLSELRDAGLIDSSDIHEDAWGTQYRIACYSDELGFLSVTILSAGPDRIHGSEDDIVR